MIISRMLEEEEKKKERDPGVDRARDMSREGSDVVHIYPVSTKKSCYLLQRLIICRCGAWVLVDSWLIW